MLAFFFFFSFSFLFIRGFLQMLGNLSHGERETEKTRKGNRKTSKMLKLTFTE
jgi:hypothetical protein